VRFSGRPYESTRFSAPNAHNVVLAAGLPRFPSRGRETGEGVEIKEENGNERRQKKGKNRGRGNNG